MPSVFDKKISEIKKRTKELAGKVDTLAEAFLKELIDKLISDLQYKQNGELSLSKQNIALISTIDQAYQRFMIKVAAPQLTEIVNDGARAIMDYNTDYYSEFGSGAKYTSTREGIQSLMMDRLGLSGSGTRLKPGGFMDSMLKDQTVATQIKNYSLQELMKGSGFKSFKTGLGKMVRGDQERLGAFQQHFRQYSYDLFVKVDRTDSVLTAKALDLQYFVYQGTLIETSRDFCIERAGKVFSTDEAEKWIDDPWIQKNLKKGYISSYNPLTDMGLFGCRHTAQFMDKKAADYLRKKAGQEPLPSA